ncbi:MBL fold metallo-hydrolase [Rubrobacter marinus]|uniref:MBL fold metallo-hydrolase n=1 Tax=Rubrobacter marinus TaxID=2653852 RepID=A0A6G8PTY1_9ACTN|nr:MBL fold metallo-hydrolase [Rubrobacter marinus]QIN77794.1 MBL fold metallo-hydrolase [Rubrobacter marinus]
MDFLTIRAENPGPLTLEGTNTYAVGGTVVDPGPDDEGHLRAILAAGPVERIVLTHRHPDHASGAARLSDLSGAPVLSHGDGLGDGDEVAPGLVCVHTPGHAPDHLCFWRPESGTLLSGDLIAGRGSIMISPPEGDLAAYMDSLEKVRALSPKRILPGHGPEVAEAVAKIDEYLAHRREREGLVVAALREGASTVGEVVELAYRDTPREMHPYAALAARAHLAKLGRDLPG